MQQMCNPQLITPFTTWKGFVSTFGGPPMDDYFEFMHAHDIQIEEWWLYWSPNYVYIIKGIVAPIGAMATPSINSTSGSRNVSDSGTI
jgi:hypothetical protein